MVLNVLFAITVFAPAVLLGLWFDETIEGQQVADKVAEFLGFGGLPNWRR